jgi:DNA processing protein
MDDSLKYKIALTMIHGIGNILAKNLIAYIGSVEGIFKEKRQNLAKIPGIGEVLSKEIVSHSLIERAEKEIEFISKNQIKAIFFTEKDYPYRLKECPDSPILLYCKGNTNFNEGKFVGIVGTRSATQTGKENCTKLVSDLAAMVPQLTIVSGLAYGIDIYSHKAAVENHLPTIGVLGHGLDWIYPAAHRSTAIKMLAHGALLTEFISETNPDKPNFVKRNRIIAGLCDALVVVESGIKGGALITAELANDYNRDVFAFPGRVDDIWSKGCNSLIKSNKAFLMETAEDLLQIMNWEKLDSGSEIAPQVSMYFDLAEEEKEILFQLRQHADGLQVNELAIQMSKPFSKISSLLLQMEFKGLVKCLPGNIYRIIK